MVYLMITSPTADEEVPPGALPVSGFVPWDGGPPTPVSVRLGGGPAVTASVSGCSVIRYVGGFCGWSATVIVPAVTGQYVITATSGDATASVTIGVGEGTTGTTTINTLFAGTCIAKSALTVSSSEQVGLQFSETPSGPASVTITSFPSITFPTSTAGTGVTIKVTMSLDPSSPVTGTFDPGTGTIAIPGVILDVSATITVVIDLGIFGKHSESMTESGTLTVTLTTDPTNSGEAPLPVFSDTGASVLQSGTVVLVGDGTYSTPIFGMTDGGISLNGTITPAPALTPE